MTHPPLYRALAAGADVAVPDAELLRRFVADRDGPAFELLVRRHAPLVWKVCRAVHPADSHAAEDAFQATFLLLARKAAAVREPSAAGWLFRVARNAAHRARAIAAKRATELLPADVPARGDPDAVEAAESGAIVAEEVGRLNDKFREPVLLCLFEGCTHAEAAERLGWPVGTVASRLARAKDRLRERLARRGLAPASLAPLAAPPALVRSALVTAVGPPGAVPPEIRTLAEGALPMSSKPKLIAAAALLVAAGLTVAVTLAGGPGDKPPPAPQPGKVADAAAEDLRAMAGVWRVVRVAAERGEAPANEIEKMSWTIRGDEVIASDGDPTHSERARIKLDPRKSPKEIDMPPLTGPEAERGKTLQGIYELKGDTLTLCFADSGSPRPREFAAGKTGGLMVLARPGTTAEALLPLEGAWKVVELSVNGKDRPESDRRLLRWVVFGDVLWLIDCGEHAGDVKAAIRRGPGREIDLVPANGPPDRRGKPMRGLYEWKDGKLTVALRTSPEGPRPTDLKPGDGVTRFVLEKVAVK